MDTGETATWPTTSVPAIATSETISWPASRKALTMHCSVWLECGAFRNAEIVTASIAGTSAGASHLISICITTSRQKTRARMRALDSLSIALLSVIHQEAAQLFAAAGMTQLAQRLGLYLADPLAGDVELLAHLFERVIGVHVDAEAHAQYLRFPRG